jgi:uncharacterized protein YutE (UPF0331/DUF86 family)
MTSFKNPEILIPKLDSLARCLMRIESKKPFTVEALQSNPDLQDVISINLERAVQQCVDMAAICIAELALTPPSTMNEGFETLARAGWITPEAAQRMQKSVAFRNIAVHEYEKIDWAIVHAISHKNVEDLKAFGRAISEKSGLG